MLLTMLVSVAVICHARPPPLRPGFLVLSENGEEIQSAAIISALCTCSAAEKTGVLLAVLGLVVNY